MSYETAAEIVAEQIAWWQARGIGLREACRSLRLRRRCRRWGELRTYLIRWLMRA